MGCKLHSEMPQNDDLKNYQIIDYNKVEYIPMKEEVKNLDRIEVMIASQLSQFEVKEDSLKEKVLDYSVLTVSGVDDKAGRKAVSEARKDLKFIRTGITSTGKDLRENFTRVTKAIIAREKELIAITQPEENRLGQIESDIAEKEEELERIRLHEEQELIISRTMLLESYGATFNGVQYQLGDHSITIAEVRLFTGTEFSRVESFFKEDFENFEQLKLEAEIENRDFLKSLSDRADNYLLKILGRNVDDFPHEELNSEEELTSFLTFVETQIAKEKKDKADDENKRLADEELKAAQDILAEIDKQQKVQQVELDRKQKELDVQLLNIKIEKFNNRRTTLLSEPTFVSPKIIDNIGHEVYRFDEEKWSAFLELSRNEYKESMIAEEKRRIEMAPDVDVLKELIDKLKKTMIPKPVMKTQKGSATLNNVSTLIGKTITYIEEQIKAL